MSSTGLIDRNRLPTDQFDWGIIKWLVAPNQPAGANMTLGEVVALPGQGHDRHNHPDAEEILYFLSGTAMQMVDDNEPYEVRAGDCVYIPQGRLSLHSQHGLGTVTRDRHLQPRRLRGSVPDAGRLSPGRAGRTAHLLVSRNLG